MCVCAKQIFGQRLGGVITGQEQLRHSNRLFTHGRKITLFLAGAEFRLLGLLFCIILVTFPKVLAHKTSFVAAIARAPVLSSPGPCVCEQNNACGRNIKASGLCSRGLTNDWMMNVI